MAAAWTRPVSATWRYLRPGSAGVAGLVVWGLHRDTPELAAIGLPVFSYGSYPAGPVRLDEREPEALVTARFGPHLVSAGDIVFADDDGVLFVAAERTEQVLVTAHQIWQTERDQARRIREGHTLREQTASMTTWPGAPRTRHTPSGGICAASAGPSKNRLSRTQGLADAHIIRSGSPFSRSKLRPWLRSVAGCTTRAR